MIVVFQNMYVDVFDLSEKKLVHQFGPFKTQQIIVDEYCTFLAVLGDN